MERTVDQLRGGLHDLIRQVSDYNHRSLADYSRYAAVQANLLALRLQLIRLEILQANQEHLPAATAANAMEAHRDRIASLTAEILNALLDSETHGIQLGSDAADPEVRASHLCHQADLLGERLLNRVLAA